MTDAPPTRAERFAAYVRPAAQAAGYVGHGSKARLAADTGMTDSSVSRMLAGQAIPDPRFFEAIAEHLKIDVRDLLVEAGIISARLLTETSQSQVRSRVTPETAADELGFTDPVERQMFLATVERLRRNQHHPSGADQADETGGAAAEH